jgi:hypothetical protein
VFGRQSSVTTQSRQEGQDFWLPFLSTLGAGTCLTALGWVRVEHLWAGPVPGPLLYLALQSLGVPRGVWFLAGPVLFFTWSPQLLVGFPRVPTRSTIALGVLTIVTGFHHWVSWDYAVSHRGWPSVLAILTVSTGCLALLWALWLWSRRTPAFWRGLLFHFGMFMWLTTLAFPSILELV